ncbi:MAG: dienelactone hydrolase family protein [Rhodothermales bacterium]
MHHPPRSLEGFAAPFPFTTAGMAHWVYVSHASGPPVLLMHELPGLTPECKRLADTLAAEGFRVYMPLLFGDPEETAVGWNTVRVCISREFYLFSRQKTSPVVRWMRALVRAMTDREGVDRVGVIGMCLTGGFALALVAEPAVDAVVSAQPSLPLLFHGELGLAAGEQAAVVERVGRMGPCAVLGFRYEKDRLCRQERFDRLRALLGDGFDGHVIPGAGHATLTRDLDPQALENTLAYLKKRLA